MIGKNQLINNTSSNLMGVFPLNNDINKVKKNLWSGKISAIIYIIRVLDFICTDSFLSFTCTGVRVGGDV